MFEFLSKLFQYITLKEKKLNLMLFLFILMYQRRFYPKYHKQILIIDLPIFEEISFQIVWIQKIVP